MRVIHIQKKVKRDAAISDRNYGIRKSVKKSSGHLYCDLLVMEGSYLVVLASDHSSAVNSLMSTTGVTAHREGLLWHRKIN